MASCTTASVAPTRENPGFFLPLPILLARRSGFCGVVVAQVGHPKFDFCPLGDPFG
jgi:hypothetical protein